MMTHTAQSVPQKGTLYTQLSLSIHHNTTNRKQSSIKRAKQYPKLSYFESHDYKTYNAVIQKANNQLQEYLFNLNDHIKKVIQKREADYIAAFQNHFQLVQKQLVKVKKDADYANSKQRTVSLQEVIVRLERQCTIFRHQAMRYFQLVQEKQEQTKNLKRELQLLKRQLQVSEFSKRKIFQKLKIDTAMSDIELFEANPQFCKQFKKSKQKLKEKTQTQASTGFKDRKFRKTLLQFDLKNSSDFFKRPQTSKKTARSFLTNFSVREQLSKNQTVKKQETIMSESNQKYLMSQARKVSSVVNLSCNADECNQVETDACGLMGQNMSYVFGEHIKQWLKQVLTRKFIKEKQLLKGRQEQKYGEKGFKFNSEQNIQDFLDLLLGSSHQQSHSEQISLQMIEKSQNNKAESSAYPFERISTHKKLQKVLDSSIYTVEKTQKQIDFIVGSDSTVRSKVLKHPSKRTVNSSRWMDFRINKSEIKSRTRLQTNLNTYMEKQSQKQS